MRHPGADLPQLTKPKVDQVQSGGTAPLEAALDASTLSIPSSQMRFFFGDAMNGRGDGGDDRLERTLPRRGGTTTAPSGWAKLPGLVYSTFQFGAFTVLNRLHYTEAK